MAGEYGTDTNDQCSNTFLPTFISIPLCFLNFIFNWRKIALQCCVDFWRLRYREGPCGRSGRIVGQLERVVLTCTHCAALSLVAQSCPTLQPHGQQPTRLFCPWDSPGKNTGGGCHALPQRISSTNDSNPDLPHCRQILYCLSQQGSPGILEWVAYLSSRGSSPPRN